MNYYELLFTTLSAEEYQQDLLINALGEIGFDTFEELNFGFKAYISSNKFNKARLEECLEGYHNLFAFSYEVNLIPEKNWNEVWESNFEPITIDTKIYVRATFHEPKPGFLYEIIIDPKMAFGTGHHQTTAMMLEFMLEADLANKQVLDMGCGTGILAIMASKAHALSLTAIDNDPVCLESTIENARLNEVTNITALCGSREIIPDKKFDLIFANINRNILLDQLESYNKVLCKGGGLYLSGFYEKDDLAILISKAHEYGIKYISHKTNSNWAAAKFVS